MAHEVWQRIETWLADHAPTMFEYLLPPASPEQIEQAEAAFGQALPDEMRASLAVHDGQRFGEFEVFGDWGLISLRKMIAFWRSLGEMGLPGHDDHMIVTTGNVRPRWWTRGWIPVANNGGGDYLCLDLDPPPGGQRGQIIAFWHDMEKREVVAASFVDWLADIAARLGNDEFAVVGDDDRLEARD